MKHPPQIVHAFRNGSEQAFKDIYESLHKRLVMFANVFLSSREASEDVVQLVWLNFVQLKHRFETINDVRAYLFMSVRNKAFSALKAEGVKQRARDQIRHLNQADLEKYALEKMVEDEYLARLLQAIERLPPRQKEVVQLILKENCTDPEVAQRLNLEVNAVYVIKHKAIKQLKELVNYETLVGGRVGW